MQTDHADVQVCTAHHVQQPTNHARHTTQALLSVETAAEWQCTHAADLVVLLRLGQQGCLHVDFKLLAV